jgi:hypothetical protein
MNYLVFELVKINTEDYLSGAYRAIQDEVVFFATMPTTFDYRLAARDAIAQTDSNVFLTRFDYSPERCSITGTFGVAPRAVPGALLASGMTGWERLKEFEDSIIKKSKKVVIPPDGDDERYFYALNYYDFYTQKFGHINIQSFGIRSNAQENTQLHRYSCDFVIIGDLIDVQSFDPLLSILEVTLLADNVLDNIDTKIQDYFSEAKEFLTGYNSINSKIYQKVDSLFGV